MLASVTASGALRRACRRQLRRTRIAAKKARAAARAAEEGSAEALAPAVQKKIVSDNNFAPTSVVERAPTFHYSVSRVVGSWPRPGLSL